MKLRPVTTFALGVLLVLLTSIGPGPAMARTDQAEGPDATFAEAFDQACDLYAQGRWSAAYGRFAKLADEGHAEAAGIALLMVTYGTRLYGQPWSASTPQIEHWIALSSQRTHDLMASAGE